MQAIVIPGLIPATANKRWNLHWGRKDASKKKWRLAIIGIAGAGPWPKGLLRVGRGRRWVQVGTWAEARKVSVSVHVQRHGLQDPDNVHASCKDLMDALVQTGWLVDDSARWSELHVEEVKVGRKVGTMTTIVLFPHEKEVPCEKSASATTPRPDASAPTSSAAPSST